MMKGMDDTEDNASPSLVDMYEATLPFALDPFQRESIAVLARGQSVMVAAPTGTGKTAVAEYAIWAAYRRGGRVLYTTPVKALSNQKFRDLRALYGEDVGLLTGDVTQNPRAPILVMTTEVVRNMLIQTPWEMDTVDALVFDEVHYLADQERGTTWEEAIILCPEHVQLVCLSATVSNAPEIAAWISRTHRPITLITHNERAVPLTLYYYLDNALHLVIDARGQAGGGLSRCWQWRQPLARPPARAGLRHRHDAPGTGARREPGWKKTTCPAAHPNATNRRLRRSCRHCSARGCSRRSTSSSAAATAKSGPTTLPRTAAAFVPEGAAERIEAIITAHLATLTPEDRELTQVAHLVRLARHGIGYHHAGLLPLLKQLVETLFTHGLMRVVYATDTLALGVNMPARTCVIGRMSKWDGRRRRPLTPNEFQQMAGRAGRRGMDPIGSVVVPYSPQVSFPQTLAIATGDLLPVRSAFTVRYNTVLNLWDPPEGVRVRQLLGQSLMQYQMTRRTRGTEDELLALDERIAAVPRGCLLGFEGGDGLLEDYRVLTRAIQTARARERRARDEEARLTTFTDERPWKEPTRHVLRQAFRTLSVGALIHARDHGWGVYLGRPANDGAAIGLFLFGLTGADGPLTTSTLVEYRQIDHLPAPDTTVPVPDALRALVGTSIVPTGDALVALLPADAWDALRGAVAALDLPDLDAWLAEDRENRRALRQGEIDEAHAETVAAREEVAQFTARTAAHVCDTCPVRDEHRKHLSLIERLGRERAALQERAQQEEAEDEAQTRNLIRGIAAVLHQFGYLHRGQPTPKADLLADIFDTNGLVLAELTERDWLLDLRPEDVAEVFSWFAYDRDARFENTFELPRHLISLREQLDELTHLVLVAERRAGLEITTGYHSLFYGAMRAWCRGAPMERISEKIDLSEGDIVLAFNKGLDIMRQVRTMLAQVRPDHPLIPTLKTAERQARRGIVEQSYTLGVMPVPVPEDPAAVSENEAASDE